MMTAGRLGRLLEIKGLTRLSYSLTFKKGFGKVRYYGKTGVGSGIFYLSCLP